MIKKMKVTITIESLTIYGLLEGAKAATGTLQSVLPSVGLKIPVKKTGKVKNHILYTVSYGDDVATTEPPETTETTDPTETTEPTETPERNEPNDPDGWGIMTEEAREETVNKVARKGKKG